jgi:hypothetical protein
LTGRTFVGGLDPGGGLEHSAISLAGGRLAGRAFAAWTDTELDSYFGRYNIGWIVAASPAAVERFSRLAGVKRRSLDSRGQRLLFCLAREHSFVVRGQAHWLGADNHGVKLVDVTPEHGEVVLSLHHHAGWRVRPGNVRVERDPDPYDPIPLIRLALAGPVARLTLEWVEP